MYLDYKGQNPARYPVYGGRAKGMGEQVQTPKNTVNVSLMSVKPDNKSTKRKRERRSRFAMQYIELKLHWLTSKVNNTLAFKAITNIPTSFHAGRTEESACLLFGFFSSPFLLPPSITGFYSHHNFHNVSGLNILHNFTDLTYLSVKLGAFNIAQRAPSAWQHYTYQPLSKYHQIHIPRHLLLKWLNQITEQSSF